jgi:chromosome segregation ATPase
MKKYIVLFLVIALAFNACKNAYEKELGEVEGLMNILVETENTLLSVDTSRAFSATRLIKQDLDQLEASKDTLNKEEAFMLDDYYSRKKKLFRLTSNYSDFVHKINFAKNQLNSLKQDLSNGLIKKEDFEQHYKNEQSAVMELNKKINKDVNGLDVALEKLRIDREDVLKILEKHKADNPE